MKKIIISIFGIFLFFVIFSSNTYANPLPAPEYLGSLTAEKADVNFLSEKVTYVIDKENEALVTAEYVFKNPNNSSCEQRFLLPFKYELPDEIKIYVDNNEIDYFEEISWMDLNLSIYEDFDYYDYFSFNISFDAYEEKEIVAEYNERISIADSFDRLLNGETKINYNLEYLAETGAFWNDSINATFIFKIKKDFFISGLDGYNVTREGGYVVATKTYTDWPSNENIEISWVGPNNDLITDELLICCGIIIVIFIVFIVVIFLLFFRNKDNKSKEEINYNQKICKFCKKEIPFDSIVCPYCGKKTNEE